MKSIIALIALFALLMSAQALRLHTMQEDEAAAEADVKDMMTKMTPEELETFKAVGAVVAQTSASGDSRLQTQGFWNVMKVIGNSFCGACNF